MTRLVQLYLRACAEELIRDIDGPTAWRDWLWSQMTTRPPSKSCERRSTASCDRRQTSRNCSGTRSPRHTENP